MATANMILKITTLADLAGLKAGIDMVVQLGAKVAATMEAVDAFADAHQRLNLDVSRMIESTKGLISAQDAYQAANKLSAAGINASAAQLEGLGKKATEFAQATGQGIPEALNQMTSAVIAGSERGLRQFGVELNGSTDKLANASSALDQFADEMEGVAVKADDFSDVMDAMGNNLADAAKRILEVSNISGGLASVFVGLNDALTDFNSMMEKSNDTAETLASTLRGTLYEATAAVAEIFGATDIAETFRTAASNVASMEGLAQEEAAKQRFDKENKGEFGADEFEAEVIVGERKKRSGGGSRRKRRESTGSVGDIVDRQLSDLAAMSEYDSSEVEKLTGIVDEYRRAVEERVEAITALQKAYDLSKEVEQDPDVQAALAKYREGDYDRALQEKLQQLESSARGREIDKMVEQDPMVRAAMLAAERAETIEHYEYLIDTAGRFSEAWSSALSGVSAGANLATAAQNGLRGAVTMVANAAFNGGKITVKAIADMVKGVAVSLGTESTIRAVQELALGIGKAASSYGADPTAGLHFASAAQHAAAAALAFAVAGASSAIGSASGGGGGAGRTAATGQPAGAGQYGSPGYASYGSGQQQQSVVVILQGDAGGVFSVVESENKKRKYGGQSAFAAA